MNIETVNELIQSLESAGELSIREQKFLKLAKAFKQLAAENEALRPLIAENWNMRDLLRQLMAGRPGGVYFNKWEKLIAEILNATTATDRIVAEAEARGVEKAIAHLEKKFSNIGVQIMNLQWLADSLRKGASE
ncbi:hypothetical protein AM387_07625 [Klebsiella pneumoniae]|uniref:hypothetical protein n=1 Tax=Klebsiella pneumoniae TaxID=573 RepID=UPI00081C46D3|nr:hypothetical protein [Klebsiella pneumoniae]AOA96803.1 hypothetical protein A8C02_16075 [Klebsiella pneumoniae]AWC98591.1 hypothetical protein AM388_13650 [Klebsiella pneumoniae]AWD96307.1 hypothetical protein AM389_13930 [Klebsiella pneumoniae]AWS83482.1 hypothetical protein AM387_07625 [Klebsiella pneumoniae]EIW9081637.1 hypothetical protein [Klebsiella pneumoniae]